jgi:putative redox protein
MVKLETLDDKVKLKATSHENPEIIIDYFPPIGTGKGYTSLELLMISFGSCVSSTLLTLLRHRMKKTVESLTVEVEGTVREEHPKALQNILLHLRIKSRDLTEIEVKETLKVLEEKICPVWAMIKGNTTVNIETEIIE